MTTTTTTAAIAELFSFEGLPPPGTIERSSVPRAQVIWQAAATTITAGGASDQRWVINCVPPVNFAYALGEVHVRIDGTIADLDNWDNACSARFTSPRDSIPFDGVSIATTMVNSTTNLKHYTFPEMPPSVLLNPSILELSVGNQTDAEDEMNGQFYVMMYQYDITQAHHVLVNAPELTR